MTETNRRLITSKGAGIIKPCPKHGTSGLDSVTGICRFCAAPAPESRK